MRTGQWVFFVTKPVSFRQQILVRPIAPFQLTFTLSTIISTQDPWKILHTSSFFPTGNVVCNEGRRGRRRTPRSPGGTVRRPGVKQQNVFLFTYISRCHTPIRRWSHYHRWTCYPLSHTHRFMVFSLNWNTLPADSEVFMTYSVSDSMVAFTPVPTPYSHSWLSHTHNRVIHNPTLPTTTILTMIESVYYHANFYGLF